MEINNKIDSNDIHKIATLVKTKMATNIPKTEMIVTKDEVENNYNLVISFNGSDLGEQLRIIKFNDISTQLYSGTHVENTNNIYRFYAPTNDYFLQAQITNMNKTQNTEMTSLINKLPAKHIPKDIKVLILTYQKTKLSANNICECKENITFLKQAITDFIVIYEKTL